MIPFEKEASLTVSEEYAREMLESNWDHVVRTTPGMLEDLEERFPRICKILSQEIRKDAEKDISNIFRPGVPDFLAFDDKADYKFVEVKDGDDGLRHTQLRWLRDFNQVNAEIWFTEKLDVEEKLETENIQAYTFNDMKGEKSKSKVDGERGTNYLVELPKTLASVIGLSRDGSFRWRLKNKNELILDTK